MRAGCWATAEQDVLADSRLTVCLPACPCAQVQHSRRQQLRTRPHTIRLVPHKVMKALRATCHPQNAPHPSALGQSPTNEYRNLALLLLMYC